MAGIILIYYIIIIIHYYNVRCTENYNTKAIKIMFNVFILF